MNYIKSVILISLSVFSSASFSGCLDGLSTSNSINSKIRGFYIKPEPLGVDTLQYVILDKATCTASQSGDVTLGSTTQANYYLSFTQEDKMLYASLLSAQARDITVGFRMKPTSTPAKSNEIAYIVTPSGANSQ